MQEPKLKLSYRSATLNACKIDLPPFLGGAVFLHHTRVARKHPQLAPTDPFVIHAAYCACSFPCRSRLQQLAVGLSVPTSSELAAAAAARRPKGKKQALAGVGLDTGIHYNSEGSRPAKKSAGEVTGFGLEL